MTSINRQTDFWDQAAWKKSFTLPLDWGLLEKHTSKTGHILDCGCGYGRSSQLLHEKGYTHIVGVDISAEMIHRGQKEYPHLHLQLMAGSWIVADDGFFDAAILIGVLTSIPGNDGQEALVREIHRVLRPGGCLFISDFPLQSDERNLRRYQKYEAQYGRYGVFSLPEGVVLRHHDMKWIETLTSGFEETQISFTQVQTMNGHEAKAFLFFGKKSL